MMKASFFPPSDRGPPFRVRSHPENLPCLTRTAILDSFFSNVYYPLFHTIWHASVYAVLYRLI